MASNKGNKEDQQPDYKVDHELARALLVETFKDINVAGFKPASTSTSDIKDVILGSHLTFRYILITNLLAKAINPTVNALALQAKADLVGAFDSRSLCHKVFVPFETSTLGGKLGRSNEPYLNKPARFTMLSAENPVRKGYDRTILIKSIGILSGLTDAIQAKNALADALHYALQRNIEVAEVADVEGDATLHKMLYSFGVKLISKSVEGETCAILSGLAFALYEKIINESLEIRVHPVNQAGSSSRETLDIDVYKAKELFLTAEVKDKPFTFDDVSHAANKVKKAGHDSFFFILGPRGVPTGSSLDEITTKISEENVKVSFVNILDFYASLLGFSASDLDAEYAWSHIDKFIKSARVKDITLNHIFDCAKTVGLIS